MKTYTLTTVDVPLDDNWDVIVAGGGPAGSAAAASAAREGARTLLIEATVCLVMGEAAGMAASHAVTHHDQDVHAVDTDRLRTRLREENAYLPD